MRSLLALPLVLTAACLHRGPCGHARCHQDSYIAVVIETGTSPARVDSIAQQLGCAHGYEDERVNGVVLHCDSMCVSGPEAVERGVAEAALDRVLSETGEIDEVIEVTLLEGPIC